MSKPHTQPTTSTDPLAIWLADGKAAAERDERQTTEPQALANACTNLTAHFTVHPELLPPLAGRGFTAAHVAGLTALATEMNLALSAHPDGLGGWELLSDESKSAVKKARTRVNALRESVVDKFIHRAERQNLTDFGRGETVRETPPSVLAGIRRFLAGAAKWPAMVKEAHITTEDLDALKKAQTTLESMPGVKIVSAADREAQKLARDSVALAIRLCFDDLRSAARKAFAQEDPADPRFIGIVSLIPRATDRRTPAAAPAAHARGAAGAAVSQPSDQAAE